MHIRDWMTHQTERFRRERYCDNPLRILSLSICRQHRQLCDEFLDESFSLISRLNFFGTIFFLLWIIRTPTLPSIAEGGGRRWCRNNWSSPRPNGPPPICDVPVDALLDWDGEWDSWGISSGWTRTSPDRPSNKRMTSATVNEYDAGLAFPWRPGFLYEEAKWCPAGPQSCWPWRKPIATRWSQFLSSTGGQLSIASEKEIHDRHQRNSGNSYWIYSY